MTDDLPAQVGDPLVLACRGARCAALHQLDDDQAWQVMRRAVASSQQAVMVAMSCLGPCSHGAVVGVRRPSLAPPARRASDARDRVVLLGQMTEGDAVAELGRWLSMPPSPMPVELRERMVVLGPAAGSLGTVPRQR